MMKGIFYWKAALVFSFRRFLAEAPGIFAAENKSLYHMNNTTIINDPSSERGLLSGLPKLDALTMGWHPGSLVTIASRPSTGKTAFALQSALHAAADLGIPTLYFSLECSAANLAKRLIKLRCPGILSDAGWQATERNLVELCNTPLFIDDTPGISISGLCEGIAKGVREHGIKLVIVDYLQLVRGPEEFVKCHRRDKEVGETAMLLKKSALDNNIPVLCLCQMSRQYNKSKAEDLFDLSTLRESDDIESVSDVIVTVRPDSLTVAKNNFGEKGIVSPVELNPSTLAFKES